MAKGKFNVSGDTYIKIAGQLHEVERLVRLGLQSGNKSNNYCPYDPNDIAKALQDIVEGKFNLNSSAENKILKLISMGESLAINAVDGTATIAKAKDTFKSDIDSDFKSWGTNEAQDATEETPVSVYEMQSDATFVQIFGSLPNSLDELCLTQSQIINFCTKYPKWLRQDGYATFFLFKSNEQYFVANVRVFSDGLFVFVSRLGGGDVWYGSHLRRVVTPQLAS